MMIVKRNMLFGLFPFLLLMAGDGEIKFVGYHGRTAEPEEKAGDVNPGAEIEFFRQPPGKGQTQKKRGNKRKAELRQYGQVFQDIRPVFHYISPVSTIINTNN